MQDKYGNTAVHLAAHHRDFDVLSDLLLIGDAPYQPLDTVKNKDEQLPLHLAARLGWEGGARLLRGRKTSLAQVADQRGVTPVQLAAKCGHQVQPEGLLSAVDAVPGPACLAA